MQCFTISLFIMSHCMNSKNVLDCCFRYTKRGRVDQSFDFDQCFKANSSLGPPTVGTVGIVSSSFLAAGMLSLMLALLIKWPKPRNAPVQLAATLRSGRDDRVLMVDVNKFIA